MIVRLGLEGNIEVVVEADQTRVVDKGAVHPRCINLVGGSSQVMIQQAIDLVDDFAGFICDVDAGPEVTE